MAAQRCQLMEMDWYRFSIISGKRRMMLLDAINADFTGFKEGILC